MQVFKGFFKVLKAHKTGVIIYAVIIIVMAVMIRATGAGSDDTFTQEKYDILINDEDGTELSGYLTAYLETVHDRTEDTFDDEQEKDMIYYRAVVAKVTIPKGFAQAFEENSSNAEVSILCDPGLPCGTYIDNQINAYLGNLNNYLKLGLDMSKAHEKALSAADYASVVRIENDGEDISGFNFSLIMFMAFGLMGIILSGLLPVLFIFREPGVSERNSVSAYPAVKRSFELSISTIVFSLIVFVALALMLVFSEGSNSSTEQIALYVLNLFVFTIVTALIASMIATLPIKGSKEQVDKITNVVTLSLSFLGGVFVPLSVMGESVKNVSRFLPTYWYATAVDAIKDGKGLTEIAGFLGVELLFGAACLAVSLVLSRRADA